MTYVVRVMPRAERELAGICWALDAERSAAAHKWFTGLETAILPLKATRALPADTREQEPATPAIRQQTACLSRDLSHR